MKKLLSIFPILLCMCACSQKYIVYDNPYAYIKWAADAAAAESSSIISLSATERSYSIILSSKRPTEPITVYYEIEVGDGLEEGVDFEILSPERSVVFTPVEDGPATIEDFTRNVNIKFLRHKVDKTKDNTITIRLTGSDSPVHIGLPGNKEGEPAKNSFHTIKKKN